MLRQIKKLTAVQLCNLYGINEILHTKDRKKRNRFVGMAFVWLLLVAMMVFYMVILSSAFAKMGMAEIIPMYLFLLTSLLILFFSFFKASSVIFQMNTYELLVSLPVSKVAIVVSRFLTMYATNLILSFVVMVPGMVMYGYYVHPGIGCYVYCLLGTVLLPLLPITLAIAVGAVITAISSRMKHKSLISSILSILLAVILIVGNSSISGNMSEITEDMVRNIAAVLTTQIAKTYPPAMWFGDAVVKQEIGSFLLLALISLGIFVCMVAVLQRYFLTICTALNATSAKNNFELKSLATGSPVKALWKREVKRYFASSVYVSNTMIGYVLMAALAIALLVIGPKKAEEMLQLPNIINQALPMVLAMIAGIMPTTSCSISMEGKQWWIAQTLPVSSKEILSGKLLLNLTIVAPFYFISVVCASIALKPSLLEFLWIALIPAAYIVYTSIIGLTMNIALPVFEWDNDVQVVKQSASGMLTMLVGMITCVPTILCLFLLKDISQHYIYAVTLGVLIILSLILYHRNNKVNLMKLGEK